MPTHYELLGVSPDAPPEVVTAAYRALARKLHPDRPGGDAQRFSLVNEAHDTLRNAQSRASYGATLVKIAPPVAPVSPEPEEDPEFEWGTWDAPPSSQPSPEPAVASQATEAETEHRAEVILPRATPWWVPVGLLAATLGLSAITRPGYALAILPALALASGLKLAIKPTSALVLLAFAGAGTYGIYDQMALLGPWAGPLCGAVFALSLALHLTVRTWRRDREFFAERVPFKAAIHPVFGRPGQHQGANDVHRAMLAVAQDLPGTRIVHGLTFNGAVIDHAIFRDKRVLLVVVTPSVPGSFFADRMGRIFDGQHRDTGASLATFAANAEILASGRLSGLKVSGIVTLTKATSVDSDNPVTLVALRDLADFLRDELAPTKPYVRRDVFHKLLALSG